MRFTIKMFGIHNNHISCFKSMSIPYKLKGLLHFYRILQYIHQRKVNRKRWVGVLETTTIPGIQTQFLTI